MKTNPNDPINASKHLNGNGQIDAQYKGLTKREEFSKCFMTALISNTPNNAKELEFWLKSCIKEYGNIPIKEAYAKEAVMLADALIQELNKQNNESI